MIKLPPFGNLARKKAEPGPNSADVQDTENDLTRAEELRDKVERSFDRVPPSFPMPRGKGNRAKYERMTLTIDAGGIAVIDRQLQFVARAVGVDNYTDRWLYIPVVDKYVSPKNVGRVLSLGAGTQRARVVQEAAPTRVIGAITAGQIAALVWYEDDLAESAGFLHP